MSKFFNIKHVPRTFFLVCLIGIIVANAIGLGLEIKRILAYRKVLAHQMIGYQFDGLSQFTKDIEIMGYFTDEKLKKKSAAKIFSHAQYMLAPTILDFNNVEHEYILFICSDEKIAIQKIIELKAQPLRRNKYGMILARRNL